MLVCATAACMNRRSRMAEVMAAVPTAAQAVRRMKSRRVRMETFLSFIESFLDDVIRRADDQMNDGAHAVAHLRLGRRRAVREIGGVGDITDNGCLRGG